MAKNYPHIHQRRGHKPKGVCILCGEPKADGRVDIAQDWFRGNDLVFQVHRACMKGKKDKELMLAIKLADDERIRKALKKAGEDL